MQSLLSVMLLQGALLYSRRPHNDISLIYSLSVQTSGKICAFIKSAANENLSHPFTISYSPLGSVHYNMSEFRILHLSFRFTNLTAFPEQRRNFPLLLVQPQKFQSRETQERCSDTHQLFIHVNCTKLCRAEENIFLFSNSVAFLHRHNNMFVSIYAALK